jgi:phytoene dehydrogenase-like protein
MPSQLGFGTRWTCPSSGARSSTPSLAVSSPRRPACGSARGGRDDAAGESGDTARRSVWIVVPIRCADRACLDRIEAQVERFAPGFRDRILARATHGPAQMEDYDANYVGGDINGGIQDARQLIFRPWPSLDPCRVGEGIYLCSPSTPPGGGVHGMSGMLAARSALRHELG